LPRNCSSRKSTTLTQNSISHKRERLSVTASGPC